MNVEMSLLEYLAYRAGCRWLSDLHCLDGCQRIRLHHVLEQLPPEAAPLREWNDAVTYLTGRQPAATAAAGLAEATGGRAHGRRCWMHCAGTLAARGLTDGRKPRRLRFVCSAFVTAEKSS